MRVRVEMAVEGGAEGWGWGGEEVQTTIVPLVGLADYSPRKMLKATTPNSPTKRKKKLSHVTLHTYVQMTKQPPAVQTRTLHHRVCHRAYHSDTWRCFST